MSEVGDWDRKYPFAGDSTLTANTYFCSVLSLAGVISTPSSLGGVDFGLLLNRKTSYWIASHSVFHIGGFHFFFFLFWMKHLLLCKLIYEKWKKITWPRITPTISLRDAVFVWFIGCKWTFYIVLMKIMFWNPSLTRFVRYALCSSPLQWMQPFHSLLKCNGTVLILLVLHLPLASGHKLVWVREVGEIKRLYLDCPFLFFPKSLLKK